MTKKSWQKLKGCENEKSFEDEIKSIFHHFYTFFFGRWESDFNIPHYYCRTYTLKNSFFQNVVHKWNKVDEKIKGATSYSLLKTSLLKMGRAHANSTYRIHNPVGIRLLTRLRCGLTHLNKHKFRHNFVDCMNPLCSRSIEPETTLDFFLNWHSILSIRRKLFDKIKLLDETLL